MNNTSLGNVSQLHMENNAESMCNKEGMVVEDNQEAKRNDKDIGSNDTNNVVLNDCNDDVNVDGNVEFIIGDLQIDDVDVENSAKTIVTMVKILMTPTMILLWLIPMLLMTTETNLQIKMKTMFMLEQSNIDIHLLYPKESNYG